MTEEKEEMKEDYDKIIQCKSCINSLWRVSEKKSKL